MTEAAFKEVYVFCESCKQNVLLRIPAEQAEKRVGGLLSIVSVHGSPQHALVAYLDAQLRTRGIEYPQTAQPETEGKVAEVADSAVGDLDKGLELGLQELVNVLGGKKKDGVRSLAIILAQALTRRRVTLIHDDRTLGTTIARSIGGLLQTQEPAITLAGHEGLKAKDPYKSCVFDVQVAQFLGEGPKVDTRYLEQMIRDIIDEENSYFRLKNDMSKILYSYGRLRTVLASVPTILETKLAKEVSADMNLMPVLLEMAKSEGVDIKAQVQQDGLGRAIRSI
jgi:hypothetical protein